MLACVLVMAGGLHQFLANRGDDGNWANLELNPRYSVAKRGEDGNWTRYESKEETLRAIDKYVLLRFRGLWEYDDHTFQVWEWRCLNLTDVRPHFANSTD